MKIPQKFLADRGKLVCKILKSLYGLKQVGKLWNKIPTKFFQKIGFIPIITDAYILIIQRKRDFIIVDVYINDLIFRSNNINALEWLKN